jgi:hypothetical protein
LTRHDSISSNYKRTKSLVGGLSLITVIYI